MSRAVYPALEQELLLSERRRTGILILIFTAAIILRFINQFYIKADEETIRIETFTSVWLFPVLMIVFELLSFLYIHQRIRLQKRRIPLPLQFVNAAMEICLPTLIILHVAKEYPAYNVLQSPAIFVYFIFIVLSTLRLNFAISGFCGLLAGLCYAGFSLFLYGHFNSNDAARSFILLFAGIAAGMVARQIRRGISRSMEELKRRHEVEHIFGRQVSTAIADKMIENNGIIESRRMHVAIMFVDIRDFTHFATGQTPEEIVRFQNAFFTLVIEAVNAHDGIVNQILGDGCMISFGAPIASENPSANAVEAAMDLLRLVDEAVEAGALKPTRIGIGIHTGEVVTGNIGTNTRQQYSMTGTPVIMASRIEQLNKIFKSRLLVSEAVFTAIDSKIVKPVIHESVHLKGFEEEVAIYELA